MSCFMVLYGQICYVFLWYRLNMVKHGSWSTIVDALAVLGCASEWLAITLTSDNERHHHH